MTQEALKLALDMLELCNGAETVDGVVLYTDKEIAAIKEALAQPEQEPVPKYCCHLCFNKSGQLFLDRMILCFECGNKRCPKATSHELPCTNSNEPNQAGSIYTSTPQRTWVGLSKEEIDLINGGMCGEREFYQEFFRAIEAKLKEKNT